MPSLNTSSSADISFLLLTFFLLTSSITNEQGIPRLLPKISNQEKQQQEDIRERNILTIMSERNPRNINWKDEGVRVVVDCTGKFLDPSLEDNEGKGSILGHLTAGAEHVIASAPFKIKKADFNTDETPTLIYGINHTCFDPSVHKVISAASCTTTGLAHMIKPLLEDPETNNVLTASLSTVHAATNTQSVLDAVPSAAASDLRKNRSVLNNIILSSTGAAKTLEKVIPQTAHFGFMADSIRIPTPSVSLIALNITFNSRMNERGVPYISPTARFSFTGNNQYAPATVSFTNQSLNATSYLWNFGDGATSSSTNPTHTYAAGGNYNVTLTAR